MARHGTPSPGDAIIESMEWLKMDKTEFSRRISVSEDFLEKMIDGSQCITKELAESLESVTGSPSAYWRMLDSKYRQMKKD